MQRERNISLEDFPSVTVRITDEIFAGSCALADLRSGLTRLCSTSSVEAVDGQLTHNQNSGGNTASGTSGKGNCAEDTRLCVLPDARNGMASGEVHNRESRRDTRAGGICVHRHGSPFAPARVGYDVKPAGGCLEGQGANKGGHES